MEEGEGLDEAIDALTEEQLDALLEEVNVDIKSQHPNNGWAGSTAGDRAENVDLAALLPQLMKSKRKTKNYKTKTRCFPSNLKRQRKF